MAKIKPTARPTASRPTASRPTASRPTASATSASATTAAPLEDGVPAEIRVEADDLIFGKQTFVWIGIGVALMALGMLLMAGGSMPSPDVWDEDLIYAFRRITLAPIVIIAGLGVITYAILRK